jgi:hypothetical protein
MFANLVNELTEFLLPATKYPLKDKTRYLTFDVCAFDQSLTKDVTVMPANKQ